MRDPRHNITPYQFWNEVKHEELAKLWSAGLTAKEIGDIMGTTRNAVIGKVHRLRLPTRPQDAKKSDGVVRRPRAKINATQPRKSRPEGHQMLKRIAPMKIPEPVLDPLNPGVDISGLDWRSGEPANCRAVIGYQAGAARYCGEPNEPGQSFCRPHCRIYFTNFGRSNLATVPAKR